MLGMQSIRGVLALGNASYLEAPGRPFNLCVFPVLTEME